MSGLAIALGLAEVVPSLLKLFGREDDAETAKKVVGIAQKVTGQSDPNEAMKAIRHDPKVALEFERMVREDKWVQARIDHENVMDARRLYRENSTQSDKIAERVTRWNIPLAIVIFAVNIAAMGYFKDSPAVITVVGNMSGFLIASLLKQIQDVMNFHFGSSMGSKLKGMVQDVRSRVF